MFNMKSEALYLAILLIISCLISGNVQANLPQLIDTVIVIKPENPAVADTLISAPHDTLLQIEMGNDSLVALPCRPESDTRRFPAYRIAKLFVKDFGHTTADVAIYPFTQWENRDYRKAAILIGVTAFTYAVLDDPIKEWAQRTRTSHSAFFSDKFQIVGQGYLTAAAIASLEIYGLTFNQKKARRVALLSTESFIISSGICTVIKHLAGRARPNTGADHDLWYGPNFNSKTKTSFFSGHTTAVFSVATVIAMEYKNHKWVPPTVYTLATLAAASRIHDNKHWTSDVVFAALLTHYVAKTIVRLHEKMGNKFYLAPEIGGSYNGLSMHYCF